MLESKLRDATSRVKRVPAAGLAREAATRQYRRRRGCRLRLSRLHWRAQALELSSSTLVRAASLEGTFASRV